MKTTVEKLKQTDNGKMKTKLEEEYEVGERAPVELPQFERILLTEYFLRVEIIVYGEHARAQNHSGGVGARKRGQKS